MNWDAIGAVAEVVGASGVLASLTYLAIQMRHNSTSVDASTDSSLDLTRSDLLPLFQIEDFQQGMKSFMEKREAEFKGL